MNNSMISSSVSMRTLQQKLDILAGNIANVNTVGYKKKDASFEDVLTNTKVQPSAFRKDGRLTPLGYNMGWGSKLVGIHSDFAQGPISSTTNMTDLAIQGEGMFEVQVQSRDAAGNPVTQTAWTRNGAFNLSPSSDGRQLVLTTKEGHAVMGIDANGRDIPITLPPGTHPQIDSNGNVLAYQDGSAAKAVKVGQIKLVRVVRPQLLEPMGDNLYNLPAGLNAQTRSSILQNVNNLPPSDTDRVEVRQGYLEQSNVNLADEMTELVSVQRAFQLNARALSSADSMMNLANNLRT